MIAPITMATSCPRPRTRGRVGSVIAQCTLGRTAATDGSDPLRGTESGRSRRLRVASASDPKFGGSVLIVPWLAAGCRTPPAPPDEGTRDTLVIGTAADIGYLNSIVYSAASDQNVILPMTVPTVEPRF